jgi:hypothetical protein
VPAVGQDKRLIDSLLFHLHKKPNKYSNYLLPIDVKTSSERLKNFPCISQVSTPEISLENELPRTRSGSLDS